MKKADTVEELVELSIENISKNTDADRLFAQMNLNLASLADEIIR
jgi:hypothetical protein